MAYPGFYAAGKDPANEWVPQQYETIVLENGQPRVVDRGIVHFDLDIQNCLSAFQGATMRVIENAVKADTLKAMIGDLDARHDNVPIIKVPDTLSALISKLGAVTQYFLCFTCSQIGDLGCAEVITPDDRERL